MWATKLQSTFVTINFSFIFVIEMAIKRIEISEHLFISPRTYFWLKVTWAMAGGMTGVTFSDMFPKWVMAVMFLINLGFAEVFRQKAKNDTPPNSTSISKIETNKTGTTETKVIANNE